MGEHRWQETPLTPGSDFSGGMTPGGETASATDGGADTQATQSQTTAEALPDGETRPAAAPTGDLDQGLLANNRHGRWRRHRCHRGYHPGG